MATKTTHYGLVKPSEADFYDIQVNNRNLDRIDGALKGNADRATLLALELSAKSGGADIGTAAEIPSLDPGGVLFLTDSAGAEGYVVTLTELLAEGKAAAEGQENSLATLATVSVANALNFRADGSGRRFASDSDFSAKITALCALALQDGAYLSDGALTLSWRQVQGYFLEEKLFTETAAEELQLDWCATEGGRLAAVERAVEELRALIGDLNKVLDQVNEEVE